MQATLLGSIAQRDGRKHFDGHLRYAVNDIRRQQAACLTEVDTARMNSAAQRSENAFGLIGSNDLIFGSR